MSARWYLSLLLAAAFTLVGVAVAAAAVADGALAPRSTARLADLPPPSLVLADEITATVDVATPVEVSAVDALGDEVPVSAIDAPPGALAESSAGFTWTPDEPGRWSATIEGRDRFGRTTTSKMAFVARHEAHPDLVVGMGDSVASGHGLQRRDYVTGDGCWRDESDAYPRRVGDQLAPDGEVALVACSGAGAADLLDDPVSGGAQAVGGGDARHSQVDWAVLANPGVITLTVGANDLDFHRPEQLLVDGSLDLTALSDRLDAMDEDLGRVLERLVTATDAHIYVTTYHNPVADQPRGVEGCRAECFHEAAGDVVSRLNERLHRVVGEVDDARVVLVDVAPSFEGHGATRPLGGFSLRETGLDLVARFVAVPQIPTSAFCATGDGEGGGSWVSEVDCIHPTGEGAAAYAAAVAAAAEAQ